MNDDYFKILLQKNNGLNISNSPGFLWTPVRTKPRQEKKFIEYCESHGIAFYLPLRKNIRRYQRRTVEFYIPMFTGYVFCSLDQDLYQKAVLSNRIVYRLQMNEKSETELIKDLCDIQMIEKIANESDVIVRPELAAGKKIIVKSGPLKGMRGVAEKRKGKTMITINVEILGQSVSTETDVEDIEVDD
ncbi:MAG: transcription termination/antitermination NusG family protein [Victivallales bacterium]|jgi:transcription antitermination factor NusG